MRHYRIIPFRPRILIILLKVCSVVLIFVGIINLEINEQSGCPTGCVLLNCVSNYGYHYQCQCGTTCQNTTMGLGNESKTIGIPLLVIGIFGVVFSIMLMCHYRRRYYRTVQSVPSGMSYGQPIPLGQNSSNRNPNFISPNQYPNFDIYNQNQNQYPQNTYGPNPNQFPQNLIPQNLYQQNPYQQNPYQQNPYQPNPYQQNLYQGNPYPTPN